MVILDIEMVIDILRINIELEEKKNTIFTFTNTWPAHQSNEQRMKNSWKRPKYCSSTNSVHWLRASDIDL